MTQVVLRAGEAAIAVEAGADQRLVGQVGPDEQAGDALEERGLGQRARRSTAGCRPPTRRGPRAGPPPPPGPAPRATSGPPRSATSRPPSVAAEGLADEVQQPLDLVAGPRARPSRVGAGGWAPGCRRRSAVVRRPRSSASAGAGVRAGRTTGAGAARPGRGRRGSRPAARRSATGSPRSLEDVDRGIDHGRAPLARRERGVAIRSGARTGARPAHDVRVAGAARHRLQRDVAPRPRAARDGTRPGRDQLDHAATLATGSASRAPATRYPAPTPPRTPRPAPRARRPRAGGRPARRGRGCGSTPRSDRRSAAACQPHGGADRRPEQRLQRQGRRGLAAEHPGRRVVRPGQPLRAGPQRRLAETSRIRGRARVRPSCSASSRERRRARPGVARLTTAVAAPSTRLRRSSPSRAGPGPRRRSRAAGRSRGPAARRPRTRATGSAPASGAAGGLDVGRRRSAAGRPRPGDVARRLAGRERVEEREPERRRDRAPRGGRPRCARGSRRGPTAGAACGGRAARRPGVAAVEHREPVAEPARPARRRRRGRGRAEVVGVERGLALLAAAQLVAADGAAVVLARRLRGRSAGRPRPRLGRPGDLVEVTGRSQVAQRLAKRSAIDVLRLDSRRATPPAPGRRRRGGGGRAAAGRSRPAAGRAASPRG